MGIIKKPVWFTQTGLKIYFWLYSIHFQLAWVQVWKWWWCNWIKFIFIIV